VGQGRSGTTWRYNQQGSRLTSTGISPRADSGSAVQASITTYERSVADVTRMIESAVSVYTRQERTNYAATLAPDTNTQAHKLKLTLHSPTSAALPTTRRARMCSGIGCASTLMICIKRTVCCEGSVCGSTCGGTVRPCYRPWRAHSLFFNSTPSNTPQQAHYISQ
jgi:hypothetical protein